MAVLEPALTDTSCRSSADETEELCGVVSLYGDLEASAVVALSLTLAKAIAADDADLILDLSELGCLDPAAGETILRAGDFLSARSRRLTVRSPSPDAWRVLAECRAARLLERGALAAAHTAARP